MSDTVRKVRACASFSLTVMRLLHKRHDRIAITLKCTAGASNLAKAILSQSAPKVIIAARRFLFFWILT